MNKNKHFFVLFVSFLTPFFISCKAENFDKSQIYGAWHNTGRDTLGNSGVIFITPNYVASLRKEKNQAGYVFKKYLYSISEDKHILDIFGFGWFRIEKSSTGKIVLNRTKWIIPYIISYDGIIKREKMSEKDLYNYLKGFNLNPKDMKNVPIENLKTRQLTKDEKQRIKDLLKEDIISAQREIKAKTINENIVDDSLPIDIIKFLKQENLYDIDQ